MGFDVLFCPGESLHPRNVESKRTRHSLAEPGPTKLQIMNTHSIAQRSRVLWQRRELSAAKQIRDLRIGRFVEQKGITVREETSLLSINDGTREVWIKEPGA